MILGLKIDVDTERGTRIGIPNLLKLFNELQISGTFYLSLGPDNTGRAIMRVFRPGFLKKVNRTSVISTYGIRTLLNGVLLPGPHIGHNHEKLLQSIKNQGCEVGIHAYDHQRWQDNVQKMSATQIANEFQKACNEFQRVFTNAATTAAAPGWQINATALSAYDDAKLVYSSDCRGQYPFYPKIGQQTFRTLQIPTTLPTLDELLGRPEYPLNKLTDYYLSLFTDKQPNILTLHAELEGMKYLSWFREFLITAKNQNIAMKNLGSVATELATSPPVCEIIQAEVDGRSGKVAVQLC
jgi:undecaprenyl phosphate-alpha-L-ara4FN deformylase